MKYQDFYDRKRAFEEFKIISAISNKTDTDAIPVNIRFFIPSISFTELRFIGIPGNILPWQ